MKKKNLIAFTLGKKKFYFKNEKVKFIYEMLGFSFCLVCFYFYYILFYAMIKG